MNVKNPIENPIDILKKVENRIENKYAHSYYRVILDATVWPETCDIWILGFENEILRQLKKHDKFPQIIGHPDIAVVLLVCRTLRYDSLS